MTDGTKIRCWRLSVAANTRSGRICGTSMHLRPRLPLGWKSTARTSVKHCSNHGCRRRNAERPKPDSELRKKSAADRKRSKRKLDSELRKSAADRKRSKRKPDSGLRKKSAAERRSSNGEKNRKMRRKNAGERRRTKGKITNESSRKAA